MPKIDITNRAELPKGVKFTRAHNLFRELGAEGAAAMAKEGWIDMLRRGNMGRGAVGAALAALDYAGLINVKEVVSASFEEIWIEIREAQSRFPGHADAEKIELLVKALKNAKFVMDSLAMLQGNKEVIPYIQQAERALKAAGAE